MTSTPARRLTTAAIAAVAIVGSPAARSPAASARATRPAHASAARRSPIDQATRTARLRYGEEAYGIAVHTELRRIAADPGLRRVLASGSIAGLRAYVSSRFALLWYHQHASRMRIVRGAVTLVDVGVPFDVRPASLTVYDARGRRAGRLDVSVQDIAGYIAFMRRNHHLDIVVRGIGPRHVASSIPAARYARLPDHGTATIAGRRYAVGSFSEYAYPHEPVKIWVLLRA